MEQGGVQAGVELGGDDREKKEDEEQEATVAASGSRSCGSKGGEGSECEPAAACQASSRPPEQEPRPAAVASELGAEAPVRLVAEGQRQQRSGGVWRAVGRLREAGWAQQGLWPGLVLLLAVAAVASFGRSGARSSAASRG